MSCEGGGSEAASEVFSLLENFTRPLKSHITDIWESINSYIATEESEIGNDLKSCKTSTSLTHSNKAKLNKGDCGDSDSNIK